MIGNIHQLAGNPIQNPAAKKAVMKVLVSPAEGWSDHVLRVIELEKDGYTPKHAHPWPHINYVLEGEGELQMGETVAKVQSGSYAFIPSETVHQFRNAGDQLFRFICIVPKEGHK